jgi:hypothetical protein
MQIASTGAAVAPGAPKGSQTMKALTAKQIIALIRKAELAAYRAR